MKLATQEKEDSNVFLPQDIIVDILVRLPVKSLIRFQCVCKDWKNLFQTPCFISQQLSHSTKHNPLLLVDWHISGGHPWRLSLFNAEMQFLEYHNPHDMDPSIDGLVYSSNGLLCVELDGISHHSIWLWNPSIRVVRLLPQSQNNINIEFDHTCVGFGYSPIANDYNIVKLFISHRLVVKAKVYSLRTRLWREVDVDNLDGITMERGRNFDCIGAICWFGCKAEGGKRDHIDCIVSFDIENGVFTLIPFPSLTPGSVLLDHALTSYRNKLAMFSYCDDENSESYRIDLWVLEECTDPSMGRWSWTKTYSSRPNPFRYELGPEIIWRNQIVCTVKVLPEGEEEDLGEEIFAFFNIATNEFNMVGIPVPKRQLSPEIFKYVESLVLLEDEAPCIHRNFI